MEVFMDNEQTAQQFASAETELAANVREGQISERLATLELMLATYKTLFEEKDRLTLELMDLIGTEKEVNVGDMILSVVDNFKEKNVVWRPAGVRRFDLNVDSVAARAEKAIKKAKKETKK
jgi:hypothetical protein